MLFKKFKFVDTISSKECVAVRKGAMGVISRIYLFSNDARGTHDVRFVHLFHATRLRDTRQTAVAVRHAGKKCGRYSQYRARAFAAEIRSFFPSRIRRRYVKLRCVT